MDAPQSITFEIPYLLMFSEITYLCLYAECFSFLDSKGVDSFNMFLIPCGNLFLDGVRRFGNKCIQVS